MRDQYAGGAVKGMKKTALICITLLAIVTAIFFTRNFLWKHPVAEEIKLTNAVLNTPPIEVAVPTDAPLLGNTQSKITVVSFLDYEFQPSVAATKDLQIIIDRYQNRVKFVFVQYLREPERCKEKTNLSAACNYARLAICANEQGKFSEVHSALISQSPKVDFAPFRSCMDRPSTFEKIENDRTFGNKLGIQTPPSFFVAGRRIEGGMPIGAWAQALDSLLK